MLRFACVSFLVFAACQQSFHLGDTPPSATAGNEVVAIPDPGVQKPQDIPQNPPPKTKTDPIVGAWVKQGESGPSGFLRQRFHPSGSYDSGTTATIEYSLLGDQLTLTTWAESTLQVESTETLTIAIYGPAHYPSLAFGVYERVGTGTTKEGRWNKTTTRNTSAGTNVFVKSIHMMSNGEAEISFSASGPGYENFAPAPAPPGTWTCSTAISCTLTFNGVPRPLYFTDDDTFVDVNTDQWDRAKTCETGEPNIWDDPALAGTCPPAASVLCQAGQTADWNGCTFDCVWPAQCDHVEQSKCESDSDCASGEVCNSDNVTVHKEDPAASSLYGLCIKNRTLCSVHSDCTAADFCSSTGQCEGL